MHFLPIACIVLAVSTNLFGNYIDKAPEFQGITQWINSPPLRTEDLKGKVVLIDFWDYSCINCIRTLPHITKWYNDYKDKGFVVVGVHTPEFSFEHEVANVEKAVKRFGILYPVAMDNDYKTWKAYNNKYWPTSYLVDKEGNIILKHVGEGNYQELENAIRALLEMPLLKSEAKAELHSRTTPEIYLGSRRANNYTSEIELIPDAVHAYSYKKPLSDDSVGLKGLWRTSPESITSAGSDCSITLKFTGSKVHAVLAGASPEPITFLLDGKPLKPENYTPDMDKEGRLYLDGDRKYDLCNLYSSTNSHLLTIQIPPGISAYSFTFGSE